MGCTYAPTACDSSTACVGLGVLLLVRGQLWGGLLGPGEAAMPHPSHLPSLPCLGSGVSSILVTPGGWDLTPAPPGLPGGQAWDSQL